MTIFNYKIANNKRFFVFATIFTLLFSSLSLFFQHTFSVSAAVTDCTTITGNLVQNCSFESSTPLPSGFIPSVVFPGYGFILTAGYTGIDNWTVLGPITGSNIAVIDISGVSPQGNRFIDVSGVDESTSGVDGEQPGSGIEQVVNGLTVGQKYEVSFYHAGSGNTDMNVLLDGVSAGIFTADPLAPGELIGSLNWVHQKFNFIANANTVTLTFRNDLAFGPNTLELDNISLVASDPIPTITGPTATNTSFSATITFDQVVSGLTLGNITVTNGVASGLSAPTNNINGTQTYTVTITPTATGNVTVSIPVTNGASSSPITSAAGNFNISSNVLTVNYNSSLVFSDVHIESNNSTNTSYATTTNVVTLTYTIDSLTPEQKQFVTLASVSVSPTCVPSILVSGGQDCTAIIIIPAGTPVSEGLVSILIEDEVTGEAFNATTDGSSVTVDRIINVVINTPVPGDDLATFSIGGSCEINAGNVVISGSGFSPNSVTTSCDSFGHFEYSFVTGIPGAITITATQTDLAGNVGTDTNIYVYSGTALPVVTITGPIGSVALGSSAITGACTTAAGNVTISGSGFTPNTGIATCTSGTYMFPISITGNATITVSQTNIAGTATANSATFVPVVSSGSTSSSGGGCLPGYPCSQGTLSLPTNLPIVIPANPQPVSNNSCPVFNQYLKQGMRDGRSGISEVSKVQDFLNRKLGLNLNIDGIFGKHTKVAVKNFQSGYSEKILAPWKLSAPTGWWYQSTRSYANYLENCTEGIVHLDNNVKIKDGIIVN